MIHGHPCRGLFGSQAIQLLGFLVVALLTRREGWNGWNGNCWEVGPRHESRTARTTTSETSTSHLSWQKRLRWHRTKQDIRYVGKDTYTAMPYHAMTSHYITFITHITYITHIAFITYKTYITYIACMTYMA